MLEHSCLHLNDKARMRQQHLGRERIRREEGEGPQIGLTLPAWAISGICCWFTSALPIFVFYFFCPAPSTSSSCLGLGYIGMTAGQVINPN